MPCDIYASGGTPCIAAHSTTRALFGAYNGPLYQVQRASDKQYLDVGVLAAGGIANAAAQDSFCANTSCTITKIYDQTANHNDLPISWGGYWKGPGANGADVGADAKALPVTVGGQKVYGVKVNQGVGYRVDHAKNAPTGSQPEGIYMITSSNYVNQWCCFDYGSGENTHTDTGNATMNAIEWGTACWFGNCVGSGPWVEADLENGMYHTGTGSNKDPNNSGRALPLRQRVGEEQRYEQLHAEVRQRGQRRVDHSVLGVAAERVLADEDGQLAAAGYRRGQQRQRCR